MSAIAAQRARFAATAMTTATPQALVVMLYERLVLDLQRAENAQRGGDRPTANSQLQHAQDIISALSECLDVDVWDGAPGLKALYTWLETELVEANVTQNPDRTGACRRVVEPLRDAWREVAGGGGASASSSAPPAVPTTGAREGVQVTA